jgi:ribose transport system ATP-binding protein
LSAARLSIEGVHVAFGRTAALAGASLSAAAGEVHAVIGENGAGKSTLMKVLAGAIRPDRGAILLDGEAFRPSGPLEARRRGVAMVYQELSLCPHLTVAENILLGDEPSRLGFLYKRAMEEKAAAVLERVLGAGAAAAIHPRAEVRDLGPGARQIVEIARAIAQDSCRVLILDEPTSSLMAADVDRLFSLLSGLRERGITILYISHFLEEVQRIADSFTVLRDGATVGRGRLKETSLSDIVRQMAGRQVAELFPRSERAPGEVVLEIKDLAGAKMPLSASLELRRGEVLGVAGLVGAGRTELLRAVFGLDPVRRGTVRAGAYVGPASPARRLDQGIGLLSEDRKAEGLFLSLSLADNITMSKLKGLGPGHFVLPGEQKAAAARLIEKLGIRCQGAGQRASDLSGGNQQKVAIARLLYHDVDVLLLDEPTRGIDVGSKAQVYELIDAMAASGKAVLMVSSYLPELLGVCDRIAVMRRGTLLPAKPARSLTEHDVLLEATGV